MDLSELYSKIEKVFLDETLLKLDSVIEESYCSLQEESRGTFLKWLEFEFVSDKLSVYDLQTTSIKNVEGKFDVEVFGKLKNQHKKLKRKIEFLQNWLVENKSKSIKFELPEIDLSGSSATEKIIYLHKLGVINFLKSKQPFLSSTNSLATVLSAIIDEKPGTIQSMINPILSKKVDDKNNPLNSPKPVAKVKKQLNDIGFNLNETI